MECILRERQPPNISVQNKFKVYLENNMTGYPLFQKSLEIAFIFIFIYMTISSFLHLSVNSSVMSNSMTPWTVAHQAPLSMGLLRQEYWSGVPPLSPGVFLTQGSNPGLLHCGQIFIIWAVRETLHLDHVNKGFSLQNSSCCCSLTKSCPALCKPWTAARQASLTFTISQSLPEFISIDLVLPSNHLTLCYPLLLL